MRDELLQEKRRLETTLRDARQRQDSVPLKRLSDLMLRIIEDPESDERDVRSATLTRAHQLCVIIKMESIDAAGEWVRRFVELADSVVERQLPFFQSEDLKTRILAMTRVMNVIHAVANISEDKTSAYPDLNKYVRLYWSLREDRKKQIEENARNA